MRKSVVLLFLTIVLPLVILVFGALNYQRIIDYVALLDYEPPARIAEIRQDIQLTDEGEILFYVHDPQLVEGNNFTSSCPVYEKTIVLGCYFSRTSIYIFDVEDERPELQGVEEVTAAHEILHAAYDRLSSSDKVRLNALLYQVYESLEDTSDVKKNIDEYRPQGEEVFVNELHSIIGTEVENLPAELEEHYKRYFIDRSVIVRIAQDYAEVFRALEREIEEYDNELTALSGQIENLELRISTLQQELENKANELESLRDTPSAYNARVEEYNATVRRYNATVEDYKTKIDEYNEIVRKRNEISAEQTSLYDAIDARAEEIEE